MPTKPAGQAYYDSVYKLYASWDVTTSRWTISAPYSDAEIEAIRKALDQCGRPMVFSTSPGATPVDKGAHVERNANLWRVSDDFWDGWQYLKPQFARLDAWTPFRGPGHWPDADMIPLGHVLASLQRRRPPARTRFTKDEQTTLMSLWAIARSPLMLGMNLPENDAWTLSLLTNDEVLAVNQKSSGNRQLFRTDDKIAWVADAPGGGKYLALFNATDGTIVPSRAAFKSPLVTRNTPGHAVDIDVDIHGGKNAVPSGHGRRREYRTRTMPTGWNRAGRPAGREAFDRLDLDGGKLRMGAGPGGPQHQQRRPDRQRQQGRLWHRHARRVVDRVRTA